MRRLQLSAKLISWPQRFHAGQTRALAKRTSPMHRLRTCAPALAACLLALGSTAANADQVGYTYSVSFGSDSLYASGPGPISLSQSAGPNGTVTYSFGSGSATIAPVSGTGSATVGTYYVADYPTPVTLATLTTSALGGPPGNFSFSTNPGLTLQLTDARSGASASFSLNLYVNGGASPDGTSSVALGSSETALATLGGFDYQIDLSSSSAGPLGAGQGPVTLDAWVSVYYPEFAAVGDPGSNPASTDGFGGAVAAPEPSSLLLAGGGACLLVVGSIRKRWWMQAGPTPARRLARP
jgi:hypothetical protein